MVNINRLLKTGLIALFLVVCGCDRGATSTYIEGQTMGTSYHITVVTKRLVEAASLQQSIDAVLAEVNDSMSTYQSTSELSRINASSEIAFPISRKLSAVLRAAISICEKSSGFYDISIGPLVNLWGFGPNRTNTIPSQEAVAEALERVGCDRIEVNGNQLNRPAGMYIDLSSIAKGYGVDRVAAYLESLGYSHYMVEIGGEVVAKGYNDRGRIWRIGVERPVLEGGSPILAVPLSERGLATSGDYRNFFVEGEKHYGHTVDPHTGYPIEHNTVSVTVLANSAMMADGWATALNSAGVERGRRIAAENNLAAFFIFTEDGELKTFSTSAFIELTEQ